MTLAVTEHKRLAEKVARIPNGIEDWISDIAKGRHALSNLHALLASEVGFAPVANEDVWDRPHREDLYAVDMAVLGRLSLDLLTLKDMAEEAQSALAAFRSIRGQIAARLQEGGRNATP